jgi:hypothetical protein
MENDSKLDLLHEHYKESCMNVKECVKQRDKLFVFVLVILFLQFLDLSIAEKSADAFNQLIFNKIGYNFNLDHVFLGALLWFLLFSTSLRYFQINLGINRQYSYIHKIENKLCELSGDCEFISREGKGYLEDYPFFLDWVHLVYTWIFPILLLTTALIKILIDFAWSTSGLLNSMFFAGVSLTTISYLITINKKKK